MRATVSRRWREPRAGRSGGRWRSVPVPASSRSTCEKVPVRAVGCRPRRAQAVDAPPQPLPSPGPDAILDLLHGHACTPGPRMGEHGGKVRVDTSHACRVRAVADQPGSARVRCGRRDVAAGCGRDVRLALAPVPCSLRCPYGDTEAALARAMGCPEGKHGGLGSNRGLRHLVCPRGAGAGRLRRSTGVHRAPHRPRTGAPYRPRTGGVQHRRVGQRP